MGNRRGSPRRRDFLAGTIAAAAAALPRARRARAEPRRFEQDIVVDVHCHSFNASDLPITGFLAHYVPGLQELTRELTPVPEQILRRVVGTIHGWINVATPSADDELPALRAAFDRPAPISPVPAFTLPLGPLESLSIQIALLFSLDPGDVRDGLKKVAQILHLASHGRARVAASLATTYPTVRLFTPLLVDYDAWSGDHPASALASQIPAQELIAKLSMRGRVGRPDARIHPFVAFDPLREVLRKNPLAQPYRPWGTDQPFGDGPQAYRCPPLPRPAGPWQAPSPALPVDAGAIELVRRAIEQAGFVGVKLYPPVGFLPLGNGDRALDRALRALYTYCQAEEVPITAHTSPANEYALGYHEFAAPDRWAPVLKEFPALRLNFGHFGHEHGADHGRGIEAREAWIRQAAALIDGYPNVYADLSNSPLVYDEAYAARFAGYLRSLRAQYKRLFSRLMYGSDWWLNQFDPRPDECVTQFQRKLESWFGAGVRRDVMGRNALRFLGFLDDDNRPTPANRNRQRLRAFYAAEPIPDWLA